MNYKKINYFLFSYFLIALILSPIMLYYEDSYYYLDWSKHLALSYFDGPPMIAYMIKMSTSIFGSNNFALGVVSVFATSLTSLVMYKTSRLFLNKQSSYVATLLWLFFPITTHVMMLEITYDTPQNLFWALCLYFMARYLKHHSIRDLYKIGLCCGLLLLSKYTGIILILAILLFLLISNYRKLFKSVHFYGAIIIALIIFSPILIWNYQNNWISFTYQLQTHSLSNTINPLINSFKLIKTYILQLNLSLIIPILIICEKHYRKYSSVLFFLVVSLIVLIFYLVMAGMNTDVRIYWLAPYLISCSILAGFFYQEKNSPKYIHYIIYIYIIISCLNFTNNTQMFHISHSRSDRYIQYDLIKQFNKEHPNIPPYVLSTNWTSSRLFFFLNNKPLTYTVPCINHENQYKYWSVEMLKKLKNRDIKKALYLDFYDNHRCLKKYFDKCQKLSSPSYVTGKKAVYLFAYSCVNF